MSYGITRGQPVNTLRLKTNDHNFPDNISQCIFLNENVWISIKISLKVDPKGSINNISALVQIMALTRQQATMWTNDGYFTDSYMHHSASVS